MRMIESRVVPESYQRFRSIQAISDMEGIRMYKNKKKYCVSMLSAVLICVCASLTTPTIVSAQEAGARQKIISQYQKAIEIIREKHIDQVDDEALTTSALQGMLKSLDPHSDYLDRK